MNPTPADLHLPAGYEQEQLLARRGPVTVVRARHQGQSVVLRMDARPEARESLAELAVLATVDHAGIARLLDHGGLPDGGSYLAREWVAGRDLLAWGEGRSAEEIGRVVARLCSALDHLHRVGFAHGDLKPENVIVGADERVVLCDFGLSRPQGQAAAEELVQGSLFAIAPEVLLGGSPDAGSDLFALGALLHRLLVGKRRSAREFYSVFPRSSFLDAVGSSPEELPAWARDLVATLTAREPTQRPRTAAWVGRLLATRLGLDPTGVEQRAELRWPTGRGREGWMKTWLEEVQDPGPPHWIRVPEGEDPRAMWQHLRLFAALRGQASRGACLPDELDGLEHSVALDGWARSLSSISEPWLFVCLSDDEPWTRKAVAALERACDQRRGTDTPTLFVVSAGACDESERGWTEHVVPPVDQRDVASFLSAQLETEAASRVAELAELLSARAAGSATRLGRLLGDCVAAGLILTSGDGFCLRPGELVEDMEPGGRPLGVSELNSVSGALMAALQVCGGSASLGELARLAGLERGALGKVIQELVVGRWVRVVRRSADARVLSCQRIDFQPGLLRELHRKRADDLAYHDAQDPRVAMHRFCHAPRASTGALVEALEGLRDRGCTELALELAERSRRLAHQAGIDAIIEAPALVVECANAWRAFGRTEQAERVLGELGPPRDDRIAAQVELVRARIDAAHQEPAGALVRYERAAELDPSCAAEALLGKVHLLHASGRDREVCQVVAETDLSVPRQQGGLGSRQRALLESLAATSLFRLGRTEEARASIERLIAEASVIGDVGREAALRINLATIERRSGSLERAREQLVQSIESFGRVGDASGRAHAELTLGGLERELGDLVGAEKLLVAAMETRERLGDTEGATIARGTLALTWFERGHAQAAIEMLDETARSMRGAHRLRFAPLLRAKCAEMAVRIGRAVAEDKLSPEQEADPRILVSMARAAMLGADPERAASLAARAESLASSLQLGQAANDARFVAAQVRGESLVPGADGVGALVSDDVRTLQLLARTGDEFDEPATQALAGDLSRRGRDDRAARVLYTLAARAREGGQAVRYAKQAQSHLERCAVGLTDSERESLRLHLLGIPDPWPGDFSSRPTEASSDEEFEMEVVALLDINRRLVEQQDLESLLGAIVESALTIAGAERGFLMLEEKHELRFDTALDSSRGDIARPEIEISHSVVAEALERMESIRVSNAVDDPLLGRAPSVATLELRSILCVPFVVDQELRGAIYVDHRLRTGAFDERAERLCSLLANQAALAIQQVRRLEEIRRLNSELSRKVVEKEASLRTARRTLRDAGIEDPVGGLVGSSAVMRGVHDLLRRAAPSQLPVLVVGQSGTGKELAARSLHELSARQKGPFVAESCSALPPSLIESELFGYRRGAFTGAERDREGLIERADGGTLFLDEIGEMPLELQAKLLRVLETIEVRRLGETESRTVDFRLVVATNRNMNHEVREGRFREDLYYRLDGIRVEMPSLAEREEDIPELIEHFLGFEGADGGTRRRASRAVITCLSRRPWPGNVRELKNEIARLCVFCEGDLDDPSLVRDPGPTLHAEVDPEQLSLAEIERQAIERALERTGGDKRRAATLLGISRAKVYQRLREWAQDEE